MTRPAPLDATALAELLARLPGKVEVEVALDWPCEGQVSLLWWDISGEQMHREGIHPLDGFDYKLLVTDTDTSLPIWHLFAGMIPALRELAALRQAARDLTELDARHRQFLEECPGWPTDEQVDGFVAEFHQVYTRLAELSQGATPAPEVDHG